MNDNYFAVFICVITILWSVWTYTKYIRPIFKRKLISKWIKEHKNNLKYKKSINFVRNMYADTNVFDVAIKAKPVSSFIVFIICRFKD